jgi:microcystin-dependent protein
MQPSLALNYVIATDGIYPPRDGFVPGVTLLGEVSIFAGNFAPGGWAFADGQLLPISQNTALFSLLGTTYGGDGQTTFALPDLRGRTLLHAGTGTGTTTLGESFGIDQVTLTMAQMPSHVHDFPIPEPSTLALAFTILAGIARLRYRGVAC